MPEVTKKVLEEKLGKKQAAKQWSEGFDRPSQETQGGVTDEGSAMKALRESIEKVTPEEAKESYKETQDIVDKLRKDKGEGIEILPGAIIADVKENLSGIKTPDWMTPSWALNVGIAGAKGIQTLLDKIFKPSVEDFNDPVVLASINRLFEEKEKEGDTNFKTNYMKKYAEKMQEAFNPQLQQFEDEQGFGLTGETGIASLFDDKLEKAAADAKSGKLGKGVQRINFPEEFYLDDGEKGIMPQTIGGLEDLAGLDVNQFTSGPGYNQKMVDMIFAAREELNRMGNQQGGGQGIMAASSTPPGIPVVPPTTPVVPPTTPVVPPVVAQTTTPFDLAQFYAGLPTFNQSPYARQGLGSYNEILRRYYG